MRYFKQQSAFSALVVLGAIIGQLQPAIAADLGSGTAPIRAPSDQGAWTLSVTPYSWLTFLRGEAGVRGRTTDIDADPIDVLERLDAVPWMSYVEARRGRWLCTMMSSLPNSESM